MIVKMLTHMHMVFYTWWCWHFYEGSVSWAKTCALVIHIWRVAHKWQGRSSGTRKQRSVAEIHATDARAESNRRWCQRLSGYPSSACARGRDRCAVAKAIDAASHTVPASNTVELRGRVRAWATDARRRVCRPCGIHVWWTRVKTSLLDCVCCVMDAKGVERRARLSPVTDAGSRSVRRVWC
jgi:hypothetical protein